MSETSTSGHSLSLEDRLALTHGVMNLFDSWGLRAEESMALLNMEGNTEVDITGLDALEEVRRFCVSRGIVMGLDHVKSEVWSALERHGVGERIGRNHVFPTHPTAVEAFEAWERRQEGGSVG